MKSKDIHLRGIKEETLQKIDRQVDTINARNQSHKISRNEYLLSLIEQTANDPLLEYQKTVFDKKLEELIALIQEYNRAVDGIFYLLLTGDIDGALDIYDSLSDVFKIEKGDENG